MKRILFALMLVVGYLPSAYGEDVIIVNEDFESYTDSADLLDASDGDGWPSSTGVDNFTMLTTRSDIYPNIQGQAAEFQGAVGFGAGSVNVWSGSFQVNPSEAQYVELTADIGDDASDANKKNTVGLRSNSPANLIELGVWNGTPGPYYAFRLVLFAGGSEIPTPGDENSSWAVFPLPDSLNSPTEVGPGFHRYKALIRPDSITVSLDLYADGLINDTNSPNFNMPGVDAERTLAVTTLPAGFDNLRFGIPSASGSSIGGGGFNAYDNIILKLVDPPSGVAGDYNGNGVVDAADYTYWRDRLDQNVTLPNTDPNDMDDMVTQNEYNFWVSRFGATSGSASFGAGAVPEPATTLLAIVGIGALAFRRQSR
jgi:hypothetical protein